MSNFQTQIYEQLDKLDGYLADKNQSERLVFGVVVGIVLAVVVYFLLFDLSSNSKAEAEYAYNTINQKVIQEQAYIDSMDNGGFMSLEQRIRGIQGEIASAKEHLQYLMGLRDEVFVYSKEWFLTFDDASKAASSMGLSVNASDIKMSDVSSLGGMKHSSFVLFGYGKFSSILQFIDWLETYGKFVSIDKVIIESKDNRLNFSIAVRNFRGGV